MHLLLSSSIYGCPNSRCSTLLLADPSQIQKIFVEITTALIPDCIHNRPWPPKQSCLAVWDMLAWAAAVTFSGAALSCSPVKPATRLPLMEFACACSVAGDGEGIGQLEPSGHASLLSAEYSQLEFEVYLCIALISMTQNH
ncbi:hypothetical protein EJB05_50407, partial [Eragrostis curvula]